MFPDVVDDELGRHDKVVRRLESAHHDAHALAAGVFRYGMAAPAELNRVFVIERYVLYCLLLLRVRHFLVACHASAPEHPSGLAYLVVGIYGGDQGLALVQALDS